MGYIANEYIKFTPRCMMAIFNLCADWLVQIHSEFHYGYDPVIAASSQLYLHKTEHVHTYQEMVAISYTHSYYLCRQLYLHIVQKRYSCETIYYSSAKGIRVCPFFESCDQTVTLNQKLVVTTFIRSYWAPRLRKLFLC